MMTPALRIVRALALVFLAGAPAAPAFAQSVSPAQARVAWYDELALLPLPEGAGTMVYDPMYAEVRYEASSPLSSSWFADTQRRAGDARLIAAVERAAPSELVVRLASIRSSAVLISGPMNRRRYLVVGRYRVVPNPRRTFFRDACAQTFWVPESEQVADGIRQYCEEGEGAGLAEVELDTSVRSGERQVVTVLRHELEAERGTYQPNRLRRIAEGGVSADARFAAWVGLGLQATIRDELPAALDAFAAARTEAGSGSPERTEAAVARVEELGAAVYERLIRGALSAGAPVAAVYYAERYRSWESGRFDTQVKWDLARSYRLLDVPESASVLYVEALASGVENETLLLHELTRAYLEAGDAFRAIETLEFLREQAGLEAIEPALLEAVERLGREPSEPSSPCEVPPASPSGVDLLRLHACARRAGNWDEATAIAEQFTAWARASDAPLADPRLGPLLEAAASRRRTLEEATSPEM